MSKDNMNEVTIEVPQELDKLLEDHCKFYGKSKVQAVSEAVAQKFGHRMPKKERFFNGRKFAWPRSHFILFALPIHEWQKLGEWLQKNQKIEITIGNHGEVILINEPLHNAWSMRKLLKSKT